MPAEEVHLLQHPRADRAARSYRIALLFVAIVVAIPIWIVDYPGMVDYPNHLARCYVLAHYDANPIWQARYLVVHDPLPNLAIDLIVTPLNHFLPILISGKIFLTLTALLYLFGCVWLGRALIGKRNWIAPLAALTFYNSALLYGFENYVFGVAVFLCAFAFWMQSRSRMSWPRFLACCALSLVAFLSHLSAIMFLGVACLTVALVEWPRHKSVLLLLRQLAWLGCPLVLMFGFMHGSGKVGPIEWGSISDKALHLFTPIRAYNFAFDGAVLAVVLVCGVVVARSSKIHSAAVAGAVLFCLFLISPEGMFQSSAVDARYVLPAFLLVLLSIEPVWNQARKVALIVATLAMVARTVDIAANWVTVDRRERNVLQMADTLPRGARIFVIHPAPQATTGKLDRGFFEIITLWTISDEASVSSLFAAPGMQPLVARQPVCNIERSPACLADYDYIWTDSSLPDTQKFLQSVADRTAAWESVSLWKIRPQ
jgi:hypothetical protein